MIRTKPDIDLSTDCRAIVANADHPKEREVMLAIVAMESVDELAYIPESTEPFVLMEFMKDKHSPRWSAMRKEEKLEAAKNVYRDADVKAYLDEKMARLAINLSSAYTLEHYIKVWLDWEEADNGVKCWELYSGFPDTLGLGERVIWRRRKRFV